MCKGAMICGEVTNGAIVLCQNALEKGQNYVGGMLTTCQGLYDGRQVHAQKKEFPKVQRRTFLLTDMKPDL